MKDHQTVVHGLHFSSLLTDQSEHFTRQVTFTHSFTHHSLQEQFSIKFLAQGHTDMWTGVAGIQTADLPISGGAALTS